MTQQVNEALPVSESMPIIDPQLALPEKTIPENTELENTRLVNTLAKGFRLAKLEVLNWGTFDGKIWQLTAQQDNCLLTGNIGSGKSTLVDGLTTLLVPPRKLAFNKAAGASEKERSLESYFHGFYTSQQDDNGKARSVGLRQNKHYSVLLAQFHASTLNETITIAQVFWLKLGEHKVKRLYIVARDALTIADDFSGFGAQILQLRKKLKKNEQLELFDSFAPYGQSLSKLMGLGTDGKALELFNQTISMKSVGSVTDFVRQNMLEKPNVEVQLADLERNYQDLKRLHDAVVAARHKVDLLQPIVKQGEQAQAAQEDKLQHLSAREAVDSFIAKKSVALYQQRLIKRQQELDRLQIKLSQLENKKTAIERNKIQLQEEINNNGGLRLQQLADEINRLVKERDEKQHIYGIYKQLLKDLSLAEQLDADVFLANIESAKNTIESQTELILQLDESIFSGRKLLDQLQQNQVEINDELNALKQRKSNIPLQQLKLRQRLCDALKLSEAELPFVGELLQVKAKQSHWQGAIERVLHNFALSLVVPDKLYAQVSELVNNTHLGGRLVYYRVKTEQYRFMRDDGNIITADNLTEKVEIKPDSEHYTWLKNELTKRFNYQCCDDLADFRRSEKAITAKGQMKSGKSRHEKDDRHDINDKRRFVLGWSNQEKISLLAAQFNTLQTQFQQQQQQISVLNVDKKQQETIRQSANNLANFNFSFEQINWPSVSGTIQELQNEKQQLEQSSDVLKQLQQQLHSVEQENKLASEQFNSTNQEVGKKSAEIESDQQALTDNEQIWHLLPELEQAKNFVILAQFVQQYFSDKAFNLKEIVTRQHELNKKVNEKISNFEKKIQHNNNKMVAAMTDFAHEFPNDVTELDKSLASLSEYKAMLDKLVAEDLPKHEHKFKEMLNRDTIRAMAIFRSQLEKFNEDIDARIALINQALRGLDYQPGTYIEVDSVNSLDVDVRDFKERLKQCVEYATDDSLYSEEKFIRVKDLIEQMRNEPKWTQKVVDVRYWHLFNVVERYREDDSEKECYSDSGGKSGGQKEKLAYSILAAAILLQYGLIDDQYHVNHNVKRRFNLVVIDEAFARGSKDSTRFGLELFKKLGLQLLLVTPLQKLDVIEHYVQQVHFVDQRNNRSMLLNMTIEQYRKKMHQHKQASTSAINNNASVYQDMIEER